MAHKTILKKPINDAKSSIEIKLLVFICALCRIKHIIIRVKMIQLTPP